MRGVFRAIGRWATKVESWWTLGGMLAGTSFFSWLGRQWAWLAAQGWPAVIIVAIVCSALLLIAVSLCYLAVARARKPAEISADSHTPQPTPKVYEGSHEKLMLFVTGHLIPTMTALMEFQIAVVLRICPEKETGQLVAGGLRKVSIPLMSSLERLYLLCGSPPEYIPLNEMIDCVDVIERNYGTLITKLKEFADANDVALSDDQFEKERAKWIRANADMASAYEPIRKDSRLGKLFRPGRDSRWHVIDSL